MSASWNVLANSSIEKLAENLWRVEGPLPGGGPPLRRVMTIAKRADGKLVIHNGIALDEASMKEIEAFGEPAFLIVPNGYHRIDAAAYKGRYPKIAVYCPKGSRKKAEEKVSIAGSLEDIPADPSIEMLHVDGVGDQEGAMKITSSDGVTLVLNDLMFNMPHLDGVGGFILKHITQSSGGPRISRIAKFFLVKDKAVVANELRRFAEIPNLKRVIVSHHHMVTHDPRGALLTVASSLS